MSRSGVARLIASVGAAALLAAAPAAWATRATAPTGACQPGLGVGLVEVPAGNRDPRAQNYIVDHVRPGAAFTRRFQVCNGTSSPITVQLYPGAAAIDNGAFRIIEGRSSNELTRWITVTPASVTIQPGQRFLATAHFAVPRGVEGGERYGVLLAELPARPNAQGVAVASRVGVRVYLDVGGPKAPKSDFTVDSLQAGRTPDGDPVVTAQVHNTGKRALDMSGALELRDGPGGLSGGPFPAKLGTTLAPGDTEPVTVILDKAIRGGPWTARLTLRSGLLERRAEAVLSFPDKNGEEAAAVRAKNLPLAKDRKVLIPVAAALIGLLFLLLLVIGLLSSRRRARDAQAR